MPTPPSSGKKRRHIRYFPKAQGVVELQCDFGSGNSKTVMALLVDESHSGMGLVYTGSDLLEEDALVLWKESEELMTPCRVARSEELRDRVFFIAIEVEDTPAEI